MKTTLNKIRVHSPCASGWQKLLKNLGKTKADDEPLALTTILESNGFDEALWCLRAVDGHKREMRLYAVDCARSVQHLMTDQRSLDALDVAERFANGLATQAELTAAWGAARDAAWAARDAAWGSARVAEGSAWDAAWAAGDAAWGSAWGAGAAGAARAAGAAAWDAARNAAWAAWDAAWDARAARDAAWSAARDAAWAAGAAVVARAAGGSAWDAARDAQASLFLLMCEGCYES